MVASSSSTNAMEETFSQAQWMSTESFLKFRYSDTLRASRWWFLFTSRLIRICGEMCENCMLVSGMPMAGSLTLFSTCQERREVCE